MESHMARNTIIIMFETNLQTTHFNQIKTHLKCMSNNTVAVLKESP